MNRTISFSTDEEAIFRPDVTVAAVVPRGSHFLLVEETVRGQLVLNQPAGHLEPDESLHAAACRETLEETAWSVELTGLVGIYQWANSDTDSHFVRFTFIARPLQHHSERALDAGIVRAVWLTRAEIEAQSARLRSPMILRSIDDYLRGICLPLDAVVPMPSSGGLA